MPAVMDAVRNMSTEEKFSVINMIWRDIASSSDISVPEWHLDLLRKREQESGGDRPRETLIFQAICGFSPIASMGKGSEGR